MKEKILNKILQFKSVISKKLPRNSEIFNLKNFKILASLLFVVVSGVLSVNYILSWQFNGFEKVGEFISSKPELYGYSLKIMVILSLLFWSFFRKTFLSISIFYSIITVVMFINSEKMRSRNIPFMPEDLAMSGEAGALSSMVNYQNLFFTLAMIFTFFAVSFTLSKFWKKIPSHRISNKILIPTQLIFVIFLSLFLAQNTDFLRTKISNQGTFVKVGWLNSNIDFTNPAYNYESNGFIVGTISSLQSKIQEEPKGYSKEKIEKIIEKYSQLARKTNENRSSIESEKINVIFLMSESFVDPKMISHIYSFGEKDPIPFTRSLINSHTSGWSNTSEYGGGTANVEFEALTGLSTYFLNTVPYSTMVSGNNSIPSIAKTLKSNKATAIHPYVGTMYKRNSVYPTLGIDNFIANSNSEKTMDFDQKIDNSKFVSDESAFNQVLKILKESNEADFIHLVTMQNHMPYEEGSYNSKNFPVKNLKGSDEEAKKWGTYLEGINKSDEALKKFITEIENLKEKTVVVFWGDHWPGIAGGLRENYQQKGDINRTPMFIYKNFENKKSNLGDISPSFFQTKLFEELNLRISPYQALLAEVHKKFPSLIKTNPQNTSDETLQDYQLIEYDILSGKKFSEGKFFNTEN